MLISQTPASFGLLIRALTAANGPEAAAVAAHAPEDVLRGVELLVDLAWGAIPDNMFYSGLEIVNVTFRHSFVNSVSKCHVSICLVPVRRAENNFVERPGRDPSHPHGQFSKVQSGRMGPAPGRFELSKGMLK